MKIGIYSPYLHAMSGGERYMLTAAEYLSRNHQVDIFWDEKGLKEEARLKLAIDLTRTHTVPNVFSSKYNVINKIKKTREYDLIIVLSDGSVPTTLARKNIIHFQRPFSAYSGKNISTKLKLSRYQTVICNSQFTKRWIDKTFQVCSTVLYPPVATHEFKSGTKQKLIVSVGRFHPFKKHDVLIAAFSALSQVLAGWKLVILGGLLPQDTVYFEGLSRLSQKSPVTLLPNASFETLKDYYSRAKLYWHGAGAGENEHVYPEAMEHFGITTVEAMAAGCVPLVYNGGGQAEIVKHNASGMLWNTEEELITQTIQLIKHPARIKKLRTAAEKEAKRYSVERFYEELEKIVGKKL